jgi:hypothetical protein
MIGNNCANQENFQGAGTTTYSINCAPGTDGSDCGMGPGMFFTSGPATVEWSMSEPAVDLYEPYHLFNQNVQAS